MKKSLIIIYLLILSFMLVSQGSFTAMAGNNRSAEVNKYLEMFQSKSFKTRVDAAKYVSRSGLTEPRLFKAINEMLLNNYKGDPLNRDHIDEMSWLCKALAASGSDEYTSTFNEIIQNTQSPKLKKYAAQSRDLLAEYAEKNRVMNDTKDMDPNLSAEVKRYISMLRSDSVSLKRDAAKSVYRGHFKEKALYDTLNEEMLKLYKTMSGTDRHEIDALSWMAKAIGSSGMSEYKSSLMEIYENSSDQKLRKYVKQSIDML